MDTINSIDSSHEELGKKLAAQGVEYAMAGISDVIELSVSRAAVIADFSDQMRRRAMNGESEDGLAGAKLDEL